MKNREQQEEIVKLKRQLCFPVYLCTKELTGCYNEALKEHDLTYTQFIVMSYFWQVGHSNLKEISKTLKLDASTLTPLLKKLEAKGFIKRTISSEDRRNLNITLTNKGKALQSATANVPEQVTAQWHINREKGILLHDLSKEIYNQICERKT